MSEEDALSEPHGGFNETDLVELARYALATADESVTEQYQEVQSVRLRASFLITVNALSATFFAQITDAAQDPDLFLAFAVVCFVASNFFCILIMMPSGNWRITKSGGKILSEFEASDQRLTTGQMFSVLAIKADEDQVANEQIVRSVHGQFLFAVVFFSFSTISWVCYSRILTMLL